VGHLFLLSGAKVPSSDTARETTEVLRDLGGLGGLDGVVEEGEEDRVTHLTVVRVNRVVEVGEHLESKVVLLLGKSEECEYSNINDKKVINNNYAAFQAALSMK